MLINLSEVQFSKNDERRGLILPTEVTTDLAYLAGFLVGDGSFSAEGNKRYEISCFGNFSEEREFLDNLIAPLFKKFFGIVAKPKYEGKNTYGIRIHSKGILTFFNKVFKIPIGKKSHKVSIPQILLSSDKLTKSFIQGFADADFSLCLKRRYKKIFYYPNITGVSKSKIIMKQISEFLHKKKIPHSLLTDFRYFDKRFNKFWINHRIHVYGKKNIYKWMLTIGFRNPKFVKIAKEVILEN